MKFTLSTVLIVALLGFSNHASAQSKWEKFQKRMEELRPSGKLFQQKKESREEDAAAEEEAGDKWDRETAGSRSRSDRNPEGQRRVPAQSASRSATPSILNTAKDVPSSGVVLGIQVDPQFLPADKLIISDVDPRSPAGRAGLRNGDQIVSVGGVPTDSLSALDAVLASLSDGDQAVIGIIRNRQAHRALVSFGSPAAAGNIPPPAHLPPDAIDFPAPPAMNADDFGDANPAWTQDLRSVLHGNAPQPSGTPGKSDRPAFFPSGSSPPSGGIPDEQWNQLQEQLRQQQQLIDRLLEENRKLREHPIGSADSQPEELILDADGN